MKKPNFLVFMTDHQRGDTQPPFDLAKTPNLDRLYNHGVSFRNSYCPSPHCCPSRATFFSGLYPTEHGVWNNVDVSNTLSKGLFDNVRLFSEDLKDAGYQMYFSGKWHVSAEEGPDKRGFELLPHNAHQNRDYHQFPNLPDTREWHKYGKDKEITDMGKERAEAQIKRPYYPTYYQYGTTENPFGDSDVAFHANEKLKEMDTKTPFFMFVGPLGPHDPYFVPQKFLDMYNIDDIKLPESFVDDMNDKPNLYRRSRDQFAQLTEKEQKQSILHYLAFCTYEDSLFGQLLDTLEKQNLTDDTIVLYVSDHGDYVGSHRLWAKGLPCFHEAYHICSVMGYGGIKNPKRTVDEFISLADYAPTFLELAGIKVDRKFVGRSIAKFLNDETPTNWRTDMYTQSNGNEIYGIQRSVFNSKWKYTYNSFDYDELYDLQKDPNEMKNLINENGNEDIVREMCKKMWQFAYDNSDGIVNDYILAALAPYGPNIIFKD